LRPLNLKNKQKAVLKSTENGYIGSPEQWFDEEKYIR